MSFLDERAGLAGKVALVAGGGGGLGRACALDLARAGVSLALADVDRGALARTATDARRHGVAVLEDVVDVRDPEMLARLFDSCDDRFGRLDILVNVVGGTFRAPFTEVSAKGRDALVRANFTWVVDATQRAARRMAAGGRGGSIVTITSIEAHRAAPGYAVYAAMKAAVTHLTRTLAVELGADGIRVNCVAPDFVPTAGLAAVAGRAGSAGQRAAAAGDGTDPGDWLTIPLRRKGEVTDVGNCVLFLASELSSYVTGTTLHPDGGALAASGWMDWPDDGFTARPPAWVLDRLERPDVTPLSTTEALFQPDGERFVPTEYSRGPWAPDALHGGPVAAVLARAVESCATDEPMHVARLTVELLRPVPVAPLSVSATVTRPGRKVQLVDARISSGDRDVAWARALRIRLRPPGDDSAPGPRPGADPGAPPGPDAGYSSPEPMGGYRAFHSAGAEMRFVVGQFDQRGPASVWVRLHVPVVPDEEPSPLQRVAAAADFGNGVSSELDFDHYVFINPDLSVHLHRPARGEWVCLDAATHLGIPGVGVAESGLWDVHGPIGRALQSLVVEPRD